MSGVIPLLSFTDAQSGSTDNESEEATSTWGLKGLADMVWHSESNTPTKTNDNRSPPRSPFVSPFPSLFGSVEANGRQQQQQRQHQQQGAEQQKQQQQQTSSSNQEPSNAHSVFHDATETYPVDSDAQEDEAESSDQEDDQEDEWEEDSDGFNDINFPSISELLQRCWYGTEPDPQSPGPTPQRMRLLKPSTTLNHTRQLSLTRKKQDSSWNPSSWIPLPPQFKVPSLLNRSRSWHAKPLKVKVAEQVLGEGVVDALELVQRDILESGEPLADATIKFFIKAAAGMATGWAHDNLNRVFVAFGAYVAATCGAMHIAKKAVKWVAWRLPFGGKKVAGPAVAFTADVLLPTSFFGPWLATYVIVKIVVQERRKIRAAATAAAAAKEAGADKETVISAAMGAALHPDGSSKQQQQKQQQQQNGHANPAELHQWKDSKQQQQHHQKHSKRRRPPHLLRVHSLQRSSSLKASSSAAMNSGGSSRAAAVGGPPSCRSPSKALPGRASRVASHPVPAAAMSVHHSGDVWGIKDPEP